MIVYPAVALRFPIMGLRGPRHKQAALNHKYKQECGCGCLHNSTFVWIELITEFVSLHTVYLSLFIIPSSPKKMHVWCSLTWDWRILISCRQQAKGSEALESEMLLYCRSKESTLYILNKISTTEMNDRPDLCLTFFKHYSYRLKWQQK